MSAYFRNASFVEYEAVSATTTMSTGLPRFGHGRDFSQLFLQVNNEDDGDNNNNNEANVEARYSYIEGLMFAGALILAIFILWTLVLVGFKVHSVCYATRSSVMAGDAFVATQSDVAATTTTTTDHYNDNNKGKSPSLKRATRTRLVFFVCGLMLVVFDILLLSKGFSQIEETRTIADVSLDKVRGLMQEATDLTEDLRGVGKTAVELRDQIVKELSNNRLCPNDPNYLVQDAIGSSIKENSQVAIDMLDQLGEFATNDTQQMEDGIQQGNDLISDIDTFVQSAKEHEWVGLAFVMPLALLTVTLMTGAMAAQAGVMNNRVRLLLSWFILPLFIVWIVVSFVACAGLAMSTSANADFCLGGSDQSPDSTILLSAKNAGLEENTVEYEITRYYLRQCTAEAQVDPFLFLRKHDAEIVSTVVWIIIFVNHCSISSCALTSPTAERTNFLPFPQASAQGIVAELSKTLEKIDVETLSAQCGRDYEPLVKSLDTMTSILNTLEKAADAGLQLLSCERIVPIYIDVVYSGTCNTSIVGLTWMFSSLLIISTMGMIMIMLRSSYQNNRVIVDETESTDDDSEWKVARKMMLNTQQQRKRSEMEANAAAHDLQLQEMQRYREQRDHQQAALRQDTSDFSDDGSLYTAGNGDLYITEVDPSKLPHSLYDDAGCSFDGSLGKRETAFPPPFDPRMYNDTSSYDNCGKPKPSAPFE